jgi:hypothetical protein
MTERPEVVDFLIGVAHMATEDTIYEVQLRAWQLREIREYIKTLERKADSHGR